MRSTGLQFRFIVPVLAWALLMQPSAVRGDEPDREDPAIGGYSPVSYFDVGRPQRGSPEFASRYEDRTYWLVDADQQARFEATPETYAPLFPDHCPYNLTLGRQAAIDPQNFRIVDGALLLFHRSEELDGLEKWRESETDEHELLRRARHLFTLFRF